jgi:hypothetical protein
MVKELKLLKTEGTQDVRTESVPTVGRVIDIPSAGYLLVQSTSGQKMRARMASTLANKKPEYLVGQDVVLIFENNDPDKPIAIAGLQTTGDFVTALQAADEDEIDARVDGEKVLIQAKQKLELRVGKASIVIDANGKITIRGANLLSRSTGPIRIKGGHVEIN